MEHWSYLFSDLIFAAVPAGLELVFGFHLVKPFFGKLAKILIVALILSPILNGIAFSWQAWLYPPEKNLKIIIAGDVLETYIFTFFIVCAISFAVIGWSEYEDRGLPIIETSIKDVLSGKYAIWRKEKTRKR